jgi:hypothetical protein
MNSEEFFRRLHDALMVEDGAVATWKVAFDGQGSGDPVCIPGHIFVRGNLYFDPDHWEPVEGVQAHDGPANGIKVIFPDRTYRSVEEAYPFFRTRVKPRTPGGKGWSDHPRWKASIWMNAPE